MGWLNLLQEVSTAQFVGYVLTSLCGVALAIYYYYKVYRPIRNDDIDDFDNTKLEEEMEIYKKLAAKHGVDIGAGGVGSASDSNGDPLAENWSSGKTDKYEWKQSDAEMEVFLDISEYESAGDDAKGRLTKSDVSVDIRPASLKVSIRGTTLLDDQFYEAVDPDECNWQFDRGGSNKSGEEGVAGTKLWLSLYKAVPTARKDYWRCVLEKDRKVATTASGAPVHMIDPSSKSSIRDAMKSVSHCA